MKIVIFGVREDEKKHIEDWQSNNNYEITMVEEPLNLKSLNYAQSADAISILQMEKISEEVIYKTLHSNHVRGICLRSSGTDIIDLRLAEKYHLIITNVPAYSPESIAEFSLMQTLNLIRNNMQVFKNSQSYDFRWDGLIGKELKSLTVGIFGYGQIGKEAAKLFDLLGARVLVCAHGDNANIAHGEIVSRDVLLKESDVVDIHVNLTEKNIHMFNSETFSKMKQGAIIVNTSRGEVIENSSLLHALKTAKIAGAALDVIEGAKLDNMIFDAEVLKNSDLTELMKLNNVLITPHVAFYTDRAVDSMVDESLNECERLLKGIPVYSRVNKDKELNL